MTADFSTWLRTVFDHPATDPEWFWSEDFDDLWSALSLTDDVTVAYITTLFREPAPLAEYSHDQVAQGLWFLIGESSPAQPCHALLEPAIPLDARIACVSAMSDFFRVYVAPAAPDSADTEGNAFHIVCYMWWDIFPTWGKPDGSQAQLDQACLRTMADVLKLDSELCQLSALHGLNHWHLHYPGQVESAIDAFLATASPTPRIRRYASVARQGGSQ